MGQLSGELGFSFKRCGKVLVGNTDEEYEQLLRVMAQGEVNGATGLRMIDEEELHRLVPAVVGKFALLSENSGILDPFMFTIALAENAAHNGAEYFFDSEVTDIRREEDGSWTVITIHGMFRARWVVNAAGLGCEKVTRAEILQAIHNPLGCATMASVKYRTRSMMGRCQGGYCQMRISQMLEEEKGLKETELVYMRKDGHPFFGKVREEVAK